MKIQSMDDGYRRLCNLAMSSAEAHPRGHQCRELRPFHFTLTDPTRALYTGSSRRLNYRFFAIETLQYIAGWGHHSEHSKLLCAANPNVRQFINPNTDTFDGAYGPRLRRGLGDVYHALSKDPWSRQAVASIWSPGIPQNSLDVPCTLSLQFYREMAQNFECKPQLGLIATMRSNDLNWGTPYDVAAFCAIQCAMARCLGWQLGSYHHQVGSLHVYVDHPPSFTFTALERWIPGIAVPKLNDNLPWEEVTRKANYLLEDAYRHVITEGEQWSTFNPTDVKRQYTEDYWKQWINLIGFSHDHA
jgi:hypothetical protein